MAIGYALTDFKGTADSFTAKGLIKTSNKIYEWELVAKDRLFHSNAGVKTYYPQNVESLWVREMYSGSRFYFILPEGKRPLRKNKTANRYKHLYKINTFIDTTLDRTKLIASGILTWHNV
ncbi:hypothetical protein [Mesobacillus foraminis]|uniref:hypothetical protein n=1 Tax=Mesobacillus foraminis TaxID=279826 RepID=UPI000EF52DC7|nr:hypothetical protein [Mesobacillus foraminis]